MISHTEVNAQTGKIAVARNDQPNKLLEKISKVQSQFPEHQFDDA